MTNNQPPSLPEPSPEDFDPLYPKPPDQLPFVERIHPDNPPWGLFESFLVWLSSVALLIIIPLVTLAPYVLYQVILSGSARFLESDPNLIFVSVLGVIPTHLLTLGIVWVVVTRWGRRPFWETLGWRWPANFGPWLSIGLALVLLGLGWLITFFVGEGETQLDQLIKSSFKTRVAVAFLAVATAPLVEEVVYRGVIYSALQRATGKFIAVAVVSLMFFGVHVFQYINNIGVLLVITILSVVLTLVRAHTGSLLPCFVIHLVFNGIQSLFLLVQPFIERYYPPTKEQAAFQFLGSFWRFLGIG